MPALGRSRPLASRGATRRTRRFRTIYRRFPKSAKDLPRRGVCLQSGGYCSALGVVGRCPPYSVGVIPKAFPECRLNGPIDP